MMRLQPAGLWGRTVSTFFPKKLDVEIQTTTLPDGTVEVTPLYSIDGKSVPPESLDPQRPHSILGYTVAVANSVRAALAEAGSQRVRLSKRNAAEFIGRLQSQGVRLRARGKKAPPAVTTVKPELQLELDDRDRLRVTSTLVTPQGVVVGKPSDPARLIEEEGWFASGDDLFRIEPSGGLIDAVVHCGEESCELEGSDVPRLLKEVATHEQSFASVEKNEPLAHLEVLGDAQENRLQVSGDANSLRLDPALVYLTKEKRAYRPSEEVLRRANESDGSFARIDQGWIEVRPQVIAGHKKSVEDLRRSVGPLDSIEGSRIPETIEKLLDRNGLGSTWAVYFAEQVKGSHRLLDTPADARFTLNIVESDGRALLELDARYNHDRFRLTHAEIADAVAAGDSYVRKSGAWIKIDRKRFDGIAKAAERERLEVTRSGFRFPASRREDVVAVFSRLGVIETSEAYAKFLQQLADFEKIDRAPLPESIRTSVQLRPYQQHGYDWLAFLRRYGLNGILADDMGLGKTLQTLSIVRFSQEKSQEDLPTLIICPTSLVTNWRKEAEKFFSGFQVREYTGSRRDQILEEVTSAVKKGRRPQWKRNFLVMTSYGVALNDQDELSRVPWLYVIVDEAHHIKNPSAQRSKAIKTINGQHKLALTGTPIQNNLEELWSLFDFVMPGYLGTRTRFRETYGNGSKVDWTAVRDERSGLKKQIHPFVLRRLKREVAKDLPDKIQIKLPVELTASQVKLYKQSQESVEFKKLVDAVETKGTQRSTVELLAVYTRLRQICNHPALGMPGSSVNATEAESGKLTALHELMEEVKDGGHRALLFCQSTQMLDIIGGCFKQWQIRFLRLDGSTPPSSRQGMVDDFNGDASITAFLISTKAGGTGLNLTGADTVIFYDHDWNPANDNQAQDRAYRIGQTKNVTVYKLFCEGTIEEKILERQELKQSLADQIVGSDDDGFKDLSKEELLSLFKYRG